MSNFDFNSSHDDGGTPRSGGGVSPNNKFSYGYYSLRGKRASMEDFHDVQTPMIEGEIVGLFGVFDGHGGSRAAEYVKENLFKNLIQHPKLVEDTEDAIKQTYQKTDDDYLNKFKNLKDAGSTASTAVYVGNRLFVANVGDSRAVISVGGKAKPLSNDHKPGRDDERERIEKNGGKVMWSGTWRVGGVLAVSRAFGDRLLKQYVTAEPEIEIETINKDFDFLVLASDGLWDVVRNEDAVTLVKDVKNAEEAAKRLTSLAYEKGSTDNITCVVIRFNHDS